MANMVLVTGAGSAIGRGCAVRLATDGYDVVATGRTGESVNALAQTSQADVDPRELDVADDAAVRAVIDTAATDHDGLDAVIHCAGIGHLAAFEFEPMDEFPRVLEVNLFGTAAVIKAARPHLRASHGRLVAFGSVGDLVGSRSTMPTARRGRCRRTAETWWVGAWA